VTEYEALKKAREGTTAGEKIETGIVWTLWVILIPLFFTVIYFAGKSGCSF